MLLHTSATVFNSAAVLSSDVVATVVSSTFGYRHLVWNQHSSPPTSTSASTAAFSCTLASTASFNYSSACGLNTVLVLAVVFNIAFNYAVASTTVSQLRCSTSLHSLVVFTRLCIGGNSHINNLSRLQPLQ